MTHAVLMGEPAFFRIKGGQNPFTRDKWGRRKRVDLTRAIPQWKNLKKVLEQLGVRVFVVPSHPDYTGMVFPANAGFIFPTDGKFSQKTFYLSNLASHRKGEQEIYRNLLASLGFSIQTLPFLFEGEADFFPCGDVYLFTYGNIVKTGFRPRFGFPPWRYQFSHRSDERNLEALQKIVHPKKVIPIHLTDTRFYHGDTCLFSFGKNRENLLCFPEAIDSESLKRLEKEFKEKLILISRKDAECFAANSFQAKTSAGLHLVIPFGLSDDLLLRFSALQLPYTKVDVSEFFEKGGGSIKCMIGDLGPSIES